MFDDPNEASTINFELLKVKIDIYDKPPGSGVTALRSMTNTVRENRVIFMLPTYNFLPPGERLSKIELYSTHVSSFLDWTRNVAINPDERPKKFIISVYGLTGNQGHLQQLKNEAETVAMLGINTVIIYYWPGLPPSDVRQIIDRTGIKWRSAAVYNPLSGISITGTTSSNEPTVIGLTYFDFFYQGPTPNPQTGKTNLQRLDDRLITIWRLHGLLHQCGCFRHSPWVLIPNKAMHPRFPRF